MSNDNGRTKALLAWLDQPAGRCWLEAERALVLFALASWRADGATLLEINCGAGWLQPELRRAGFDASGCEPDPFLRDRCAATAGPTFTADPAHADLLPYGDGAFDWTLLHLERGVDRAVLEACLREAVRVSLRGTAVLFRSRYTLGAPFSRLPLASCCGWHVRRRLRAIRPCRTRVFSALALPAPLWTAREGAVWTRVESARRVLNGPLPLGLGALCLIRCEYGPSAPLTATPLRVQRFVFSDSRLCGERAWEGRAMRGKTDMHEPGPQS